MVGGDLISVRKREKVNIVIESCLVTVVNTYSGSMKAVWPVILVSTNACNGEVIYRSGCFVATSFRRNPNNVPATGWTGPLELIRTTFVFFLKVISLFLRLEQIFYMNVGSSTFQPRELPMNWNELKYYEII